MAIHDKNPITELKTEGTAAAKKPEEIRIVIDREHIKRHNEAEKHDRELSAMLQASWGRRVEAEHRPN